MYGFPYFDKEGKYGISNRDNYIIIDKTVDEFIKIQKFLSSKLALFLFETTRYRMKFLEKYIFELIPDISQLNDFPEIINDDNIYSYFKLNKNEIDFINNFNKKTYSNFIE